MTIFIVILRYSSSSMHCNVSITTFRMVCTVSSIPVWCLSSAPLKTWPSLMIRKLVKTGKLPFQLTNVVHLWRPLVSFLSYLWSITYRWGSLYILVLSYWINLAKDPVSEFLSKSWESVTHGAGLATGFGSTDARWVGGTWPYLYHGIQPQQMKSHNWKGYFSARKARVASDYQRTE